MSKEAFVNSPPNVPLSFWLKSTTSCRLALTLWHDFCCLSPTYLSWLAAVVVKLSFCLKNPLLLAAQLRKPTTRHLTGTPHPYFINSNPFHVTSLAFVSKPFLSTIYTLLLILFSSLQTSSVLFFSSRPLFSFRLLFWIEQKKKVFKSIMASFIAHSLSSVCKEMQSHHSFFSNTIFLHCSMPLVQESSSTHLKKLPPYPRSALSISISWRGMKGFLKREALETQLGKSNWRAESSGIPMTYLKN